ncbi:Probable RNA-directed DNA polymerase from transposon BS [Eumeta japonica]|uniref:Probable RNA-directed DNA polymerase from transposon BS n=1 Tax=Eumeta variegata TaxID=151549 RepID=A0A4C1WXZ8_EUMVA|nr:Probable RNA-directed DNA polymerase from transposon BS [Eumeta japonica]
MVQFLDIALVQETYLKPNRPKACSITGYVQLQTDRTYSSKGGTALYYRRSLHCGPINIPPLTNMEVTGCRLAMTGHSTLVIVSVYLPSPKRLLRRDLRALFALGDAVILFDDFNCKNIRWGCPSNNYNGIKLDELEDRLDFGIIAPSKSTLLRQYTVSRLYHRPVILKMGPPDGARLIPIRKITNWKRVSTALEEIDTPNLNSIPNDIASTDEIDFAIGALTNHVRTVVEESDREVPASSDRRKFPPDILELIRAKNAFRRASAYPTPEYRSRALALQREVKARIRELRNEMAIDDAEIAECLADSIETQCSHVSPPHVIAHFSRIEEEVIQKTSLEPKDNLAPVSLSEVQTLVKSLNTKKAPGLEGKGLIIDEQFGFRPAHSRPQQVLRLVEYVSEGFETERNTVAVFFDVYKAFDSVWHVANRHFTFRHEHTHSTRRLIRTGVPQGSTLSPLLYSAYINNIPLPSSSGVQLALFADDTALFYGSRNRSTRFTLLPLQRAIDELGQWFRKWRIEVNPDKSAAIQFKYGKIRSRLIVDKNTPNLKMLDTNIPWQRNYKYLGVTLDKNLHFRDHIEHIRNTALFYKARLGAMLGRKSKLSRRNKRIIYKMCIRTVMTYASPVFAHAAPKALHRLQVIQNKFCRAATDAHWCVRNSILHRDLELPTISKYMKDASKRFFDIAGSLPNALLRAAVDYQPPHPTHLIRRPRNVLTDPPDALTAAVKSLNDVNNTHD